MEGPRIEDTKSSADIVVSVFSVMFGCRHLCLSVCLSVSVSLSVCLSVCLSVSLSLKTLRLQYVSSERCLRRLILASCYKHKCTMCQCVCPPLVLCVCSSVCVISPIMQCIEVYVPLSQSEMTTLTIDKNMNWRNAIVFNKCATNKSDQWSY